jgi:hypothetical protein
VIVGQLAEENNLSPRKVYAIAVGQSFSGRAGGGYRAHHGLGQLTLQQYCDRIELDVNETIEKLRNKGIQARPDMLLRNIARGAGMHASDIRDILEQ